MKRFENKVVVVTGATSGIGAACAQLFSREGGRVALVGRNEDRGRKLEQGIKDAGGTARFYACDISKPEKVKNLTDEIKRDFDAVDILFNNAGVMLPSMEIERMPIEEWQETFNVNINGMFYITRSLKPWLIKSHGCIINNASIAGMQHYAAGRSYAYSASKAAVIQFSHQMAKNYGEEQVRVNCICPGIIDTPILGDRDRQIYAARIPLGYVGQPEDVAKVVAFLASEDASYLTGVVLPVDGGTSI